LRRLDHSPLDVEKVQKTLDMLRGIYVARLSTTSAANDGHFSMGWLRVTGIYLVAQLAVFALVKMIFRVAWGALAGPYLCFAASMITTVFMAWFLNTRAFGKISPRQFAFGAGGTTAFLVLSANGAFAYLALVLGLIDRRIVNDWSIWVIVVLPLVLFASFGTYRIAYHNAKLRLANHGKRQ